MAVARDVENAHRQVGQSLTITRLPTPVGDRTDRDYKAPTKLTAWFQVGENKTEKQGDTLTGTAELRTSGVSGYTPTVGDKIELFGREYTVNTIETKSLGQEVYRYDIEAGF